jgi:hypothetical protein
VTLPPRAAVGALSLLSEMSRSHAAPALYVTREAEGLLCLEFKAQGSDLAGSLVCMIPLHAPLPMSREVAFWVLARIGARPLVAGDDRIRLPIVSAPSAG